MTIEHRPTKREITVLRDKAGKEEDMKGLIKDQYRAVVEGLEERR